MKLSKEIREKIRNKALEAINRYNAAEINLHLYEEECEADTEIKEATRSLKVERKTALVLADHAPRLNWGHPCQHMLFDAEDGELYDTIDSEFPPDSFFNENEKFEALHAPVKAEDVIDYKKARTKEFPQLRAALTNATGNRYAVLFSGSSNNRHVNDMEFLYRTLVDDYHFLPGNIFVLNYDGTINYSGGPKPVVSWPGDNTAYRMPVNGQGTAAALDNVLDNLAGILKAGDFLLIHTNNHGGGPTYAPESYLCLYGGGGYNASDFGNKLNTLPKIGSLLVMMEQCHSGGFGTPVIQKANADRIHFSAACEEDKSSIGGAHFDPFAYDWIAGVTGHYGDGSSLSQVVDTNNDGRISADEAFKYAKAVKHSYDTPVFQEKPVGSGNVIFMDNAPTLFDRPASFFFQNFAPRNLNYELFAKEGNHLRHYWFKYGPMTWQKASPLGKNVKGEAAVLQNRVPGNNNYEVVVRERSRLQHYWFNYGQGIWYKADRFGYKVSSSPAMFQNHAPGNFNYEVVVREGDNLRHYWFEYGPMRWRRGASFGSNCKSDPVMFQNHAPGNNNYEVLVQEGNHLQHYWFEYGPMVWHKAGQFGSNVKSVPLAFQNHFPGNYNYEVVVREGNHLQHYWFEYGPMVWHKADHFGSNVKSNMDMFQNRAPGNNNYELVVQEGNHLQHYWFEYGPMIWHKADKFGSGVKENLALFQNHATGNYNYELVVPEGGKWQHYWFNLGTKKWNKGLTF